MWTIKLPQCPFNAMVQYYMSAYVPYCSSDIYTGTRAPSEQSEGLAFYGRHIVMAILADLLENTWLPRAEHLVLMGFSAGAFGTEANCDLVADTLHSVNPDIGVKCIIDSGSIYPLNTHRCLTCHRIHIISPIPSEECDPREVWLGWMEAWQKLGDESCTLQHPAGPIGCVR